MIDQISGRPSCSAIADGDDAIRHEVPAKIRYSDFYCVRPGRIIITGVYHHSRDPDGWKHRR